MSITPTSPQDLSEIYQAFDELAPNMDKIKKLGNDDAFYEASGPEVLPILQNTLDKVEKVLTERGFFSEKFNATVSQVQSNIRTIDELEKKFASLSGRPMSEMNKLCNQYTMTKTLSADLVAFSYPPSGKTPQSRLEKLAVKSAKAFDRIIDASKKRDDALFINALELFATSYEEPARCSLTDMLPDYIEHLEKKLDQLKPAPAAAQKMGLYGRVGSDSCTLEKYVEKLALNNWSVTEDAHCIYLTKSSWNPTAELNNGGLILYEIKSRNLKGARDFTRMPISHVELSSYGSDEPNAMINKFSGSVTFNGVQINTPENKSRSVSVSIRFYSNLAGIKRSSLVSFDLLLPPKVDLTKEPKAQFWKDGTVRITFYKR